MRYLRFIIVITALMTLLNCEKDAEVQPKEYPYVITNSPSVNTSEVEFSADLINIGSQEILKHGFVWSTESNPTIKDNNKLFEDKASKGVYTCNVNCGLANGQIYYVRAYILTDQYEVYGNVKSFISQGSLPPIINNFEPKFGAAGTQVIIDGRNFALSRSGNTVWFGEHIALVDSVTKTKLFVKVPQVTKPEKVVVAVETAGVLGNSFEKFNLYFPWKKLSATHDVNYASTSFTISDNVYIINSNTSSGLKFNSLENTWQKFNLPENAGSYPKVFSTLEKGYVLLENGFYEYDPIRNSWTQKEDFPDDVVQKDYTFTMSFAQIGFIGFCYKNKNLWLYDPNSNTWTRKADFPEDFTQTSHPVWGNFSFSIENSGYLGVSQTGSAINTFWEYKVDSDLWERKTPLPSDAYVLYACMVIDGSAYVGLGNNFEWDDGYVSNEIWKYDHLTNSWNKYQNCPINMSTYASFGINSKGYLLSGTTKFDGDIDSIWEFDPSKN